MDKKKYVRVDPFTGFPEKDVKEDAPTTSTAGVAATGDDPTVVVRKKKKLYDGRTTVAKKFVERILKQRESRRLTKEEVELDEMRGIYVVRNHNGRMIAKNKNRNAIDKERKKYETQTGNKTTMNIEKEPVPDLKEEVELEEALKPKDKSVVAAFYDGKSMEGDTLSTDGKKLEKSGFGGQTIAKKVYTSRGAMFKVVAKMDGKHTQSVVKYIKKSFPKNVVETVKEEPMINEKIEYVEYKFKNRSDAMKAQKHFMKQNQGPDYEFMDDDINNGTLGVDAGKDDMTKHHNEVMRKFKPKIVSKEGVEEDFKGYGKHFALTLMPTLRKKVMKLLDKEKIEYDKFSRKFLFIGKDGGKAPISMKDQKSILSKIEKEIGKDNFNYTFQKEDVEFDDLEEAVANLYVKGDNPNQMAMKIAKNAKGLGLKSAMMGNQVRVKGSQKQVNDFMRSVIGKSSMGSPTEKGASNPQIDKMLNKQLKEDVFRSNDFVGKIMEKVNDFGNEHELVETNLKVLQNIVKKKQNQKVKFKDKQATVDLFTASAIMKVYDAVKPDNKKKIEKLMNGTLVDFLKLQKFAMKQVKFR